MGSRRKKFPELAARCNDILPTANGVTDFRAKSEERSKHLARTNGIVPCASIRSKSAEPSRTEVERTVVLLASEYRSAFGWPNSTSMANQMTTSVKSETDAVMRHDPELTAVEKMTKSATMADIKVEEMKRREKMKIREPIGRPHILFAREALPVPLSMVKVSKKTEYKAKFKPFSAYVYVTGNGWKKSKYMALDGNVRQWFEEKVEREKKAVEFRSRSQFGHPLTAGGLEEVYKSCSDGWTPPKTCGREITALELAATQMKIADKKAEREHSRSVSPVKSDKSTGSSTRARKGTCLARR